MKAISTRLNIHTSSNQKYLTLKFSNKNWSHSRFIKSPFWILSLFLNKRMAKNKGIPTTKTAKKITPEIKRGLYRESHR